MVVRERERIWANAWFYTSPKERHDLPDAVIAIVANPVLNEAGHIGCRVKWEIYHGKRTSKACRMIIKTNPMRVRPGGYNKGY